MVILSVLIVCVGMGFAFWGTYSYIHAAWMRQSGWMLFYLALVIVLTFATPMIAVYVANQ